MIYLNYLLEATQGVLRYPGRQKRFEAFSHDTRMLMPGEMFVAVRGEHGDGHDHVLDAVRRGAAGILLEEKALAAFGEEMRQELRQAGIAIITVADTRIALQQYARFILQRWQPTVIAVTGSTGKTTTKEAIATVLARNFATFRSWQNYNDLLGIPLSLGRLEERHEYAVLELACDHPGEIDELCAITQPQIGVLTNISPAQLQYFGTLERLAVELGTLLTSLPEHGKAFVNGDDKLIQKVMGTVQSIAPITMFHPSQVKNVEVLWTGIDCEIPVGTHLSSRLLGAHYITTMLAAYAVGTYCGLKAEEVQGALADVRPAPGRLRPLAGIGGVKLLDDTHNATPTSTIAGLEALKALQADYRIAVLGDMLRLGNYAEEAHWQVGQKAAECVDYLILRGANAAVMAAAAQQAGLAQERIILTSTHEDAAQAVNSLIEREKVYIQPGHPQGVSLHFGDVGTPLAGVQVGPSSPPLPTMTILLKGSEEARMERVTERLMAEPERAQEQLVRQTPGWKQIVVMRAERPTWLEIDLSAIAHNTRRIKTLVGPTVQILASLKADAYGHGAVKVARTVLLNGASMLGVATVSEALPLREAGIGAPILVFGYVPPWQMREAVRLGLTITLYSLEAAQALVRAAQALDKVVRVHVKVDTGMGRLGIRAEQVEDVVTLVREIVALARLEWEGIFTHFAMADTEDQTHVRMQLARFQAVLHALEQRGLHPPLVHAANSAALLSLPAAHFDMVRPGIALYGLDPSSEVRLPEGFRAALAFKTQVAQVKLIPTDEVISYGGTYVTKRPTRIAVLPVGYADGFRRGPTNWGTVLLHGQEAPLLGRVCMDQCMIDVSHLPWARVGDEVVLIGRQGNATLSAEQVAQRLGTSNYEVVSAILARVPRVD